jgi:hypothetical protein
MSNGVGAENQRKLSQSGEDKCKSRQSQLANTYMEATSMLNEVRDKIPSVLRKQAKKLAKKEDLKVEFGGEEERD